jgi:hypothetical protein
MHLGFIAVLPEHCRVVFLESTAGSGVSEPGPHPAALQVCCLEACCLQVACVCSVAVRVELLLDCFWARSAGCVTDMLLRTHRLNIQQGARSASAHWLVASEGAGSWVVQAAEVSAVGSATVLAVWWRGGPAA